MLAVIPLLTKQAVSTAAAGHPVARRTHPYAEAWRRPNEQTGESETPDATCFAFADPLMRRVVDQPLSVFTEAFRAIKVAAELQAATRDNKVIGITSTLQNEGKSTIACNLAALMADAGKRVILMDTDLRNPTLVRALTPRPTVGLMELLTGKIDLQQAIGWERATGLAILPLVLNERIAHSDEILSSQAFRSLVDQLRQRYDFVIMDLPPIAPIVDVRATVPVTDSHVFVVECGARRSTPSRVTRWRELYDRLLGAVLNKSNLKALERFEQQRLYQNGYYTNHNHRHVNVTSRLFRPLLA